MFGGDKCSGNEFSIAIKKNRGTIYQIAENNLSNS